MGDGRPGLDAHAADAFNLPVIGVAKTPFRAATQGVDDPRLLWRATAIDDAARQLISEARRASLPGYRSVGRI